MTDFQNTDIHGNTVICHNNRVSVTLKDETRVRNIGHFDGDDYVKGHPVKLNDKKHLFRKGNGWGVNYIVVQAMKPNAYVIIHANIGTGRIQASKIMEHCDKKQFSKQGYELQYIVPLDLWERVE